MKRSAARHAAVWIFALLASGTTALAFPTLAHADDASEAVSRFESGVKLYEADNFEGALVEFNTAYKLSKNYKLLYNIGICQNALKDYAIAAESFQRYLNEGGSEITEARRTDVNDRLAKLALTITRVRISTDAPAGSQLLVDDQPVGTTPLPDTVTVKIGRRQFSITAQGKTATKSVDVGSGDQNAPITLNLADVATPSGSGTGDANGRGGADDGPSFPWAFWGLTALFGGGAAVTGTLAVGKRNDFEKRQAEFGVDKQTLEDERSKTQTLGLVTDILLVGTVLAGGVSTYMTIRYFGKKKSNSASNKNGSFTILPMGAVYTRSF